jgi:hypothetical protein
VRNAMEWWEMSGIMEEVNKWIHDLDPKTYLSRWKCRSYASSSQAAHASGFGGSHKTLAKMPRSPLHGRCSYCWWWRTCPAIEGGGWGGARPAGILLGGGGGEGHLLNNAGGEQRRHKASAELVGTAGRHEEMWNSAVIVGTLDLTSQILDLHRT